MRPIIYTAITVVALLFISCNTDSTDTELIQRFNNNKIYLDSFVTSLQHNQKLDSLFQQGADEKMPDIESTYPKEFEWIKKIDIASASSLQSICKTCPRWYNLKTNWGVNHPIYLIYNFRDTIQNAKGFYKKDNYKNETWGLGDKWIMFRFVDTIKDAKQ